MMTPRLQLLKELLTDDGVIFISIDDNEQSHLKILCDSIFEHENFIGQFIWETKRGARGKPPKSLLTTNHEYILCYSKNKELVKFKGVERDEKDFDNPDNDPRGLWRDESITATGKQNNYYDIVDEKTGHIFTGNWAFSKESIKKMIEDNLILFPNTNSGVPRQKKFINSYTNETKAIVTSGWFSNENKKDDVETLLGWHSTENATKNLISLFEGEKVFDFPKPLDLIKFLISQTTDKNDIILDSFAGSGTTAQAVMDLNKEGVEIGNRKFILIQLDEKIPKDHALYMKPYNFRYVHQITKSRIDKVIKKFKYQVGYTYQTLGHPIDPKNILSGENLPPYQDLAEYVFYLRTGTHHPSPENINANTYKVGVHHNVSIYLFYEPDNEKLKKLAVTLDWIKQINETDQNHKVIYTPELHLDEDDIELKDFKVEFVNIPYQLFESRK